MNSAFFDKEFYEYGRDIINHELFQQGKEMYSHGTRTIYDHSIDVALRAWAMVKNSETINRRCVVRAALLHDFFLYEWHVPGLRYVLHGWAHPKIAANKARDVFNITGAEYEAIRCHMWPWTLFHWPKSREGWIVSLADKLTASRETFLLRGRRHKLKDPPPANGQ